MSNTETSSRDSTSTGPAARSASEKIRRVTSRIPRWAIAFFLALLVLLAGRAIPGVDDAHSGLVGLAIVFCAGAIQRFKARQALLMLALTVGSLGVSVALLLITRDAPAAGGMWSVAISAAVPFVLLGLGEMAAADRQSFTAVLCIFTAAFGCGAVLKAGSDLLGWSVWSESLPNLYVPLTGLLAWIAMPAAIAAARRKTLSPKIALLVVVVTAGVAYQNFYRDWSYRLAERSLESAGPLKRYQAVALLADRGRPGDYALILNELIKADWKYAPEPGQRDWRREGIWALADSLYAPEAADALGPILRTRRTVVLANLAGQLLLDNEHAEAVPILLRYAMDPHGSYRNRQCLEQLERIRLPEAAMAVLAAACGYDLLGCDPNVMLPPQTQERLRAILGIGAGGRLGQWRRVYEDVVAVGDSPLPPEVQADVDRELRSILAYYDGYQQWKLWRDRLAAQLSQEGQDPQADRARADAAMRVAAPDWNAPSAEAFEEQVEMYRIRVEAAIQGNFPVEDDPPPDANGTLP